MSSAKPVRLIAVNDANNAIPMHVKVLWVIPDPLCALLKKISSCRLQNTVVQFKKKDDQAYIIGTWQPLFRFAIGEGQQRVCGHQIGVAL